MNVNGSEFIYLFFILYVDDILVTTNDIGLLHEINSYPFNNFKMKDMVEANYVIDIEIFRD